ncbi:Carbonic anhydrase-related protein 10 [Echinococcus granulosus]|uniref:Carbonic anhydrase n=1 Tax=Echinococcus granulosus TaxID=6210 RepID=A0A068WV66_ECHGR|nr:Carbonic anhydrase-related protein 10 [Echinococcus granulosus]CDS21594.1 carbonic anhydrase [Echinococcus granulosus]
MTHWESYIGSFNLPYCFTDRGAMYLRLIQMRLTEISLLICSTLLLVIAGFTEATDRPLMRAEDLTTCKHGKRQSPIDIVTDALIFDLSLHPVKLHGADQQLTISVENAGHDLLFAVIFGVITFSGGPLSYTYRLSEMRLKFGSSSDRGSEHRVNSFAYPGELQLYAYNSDLYQSFADAVDRPNGIAAFSSMLQMSTETNKDLMGIVMAAEKTQFLGNKFHLKGIELQALFPAIDEYMTYEGSLPFPSCAETVTWIILNRSIQISLKEMKVLRQLRTDKTLWSTSMADNFRPVNPLNNRSVRTNIRFADSESVCEYRPSVSYFASHPLQT